MIENSHRQFSLGYAFSMTAVVAIAVSAFLTFQEQIGTSIALGYSVWVGLMGVLSVQVLFRIRKRPVWRTLIATIILALGLIPIFNPSAVLPDYDLRVRSFANNIAITKELDRIATAIKDPEAILAASRQLHGALMELPESERRISGDSELIPPTLSELKPLAIHASKNVLQLHLIRNYEESYGLFAYPDDYRARQVGTQRIIDGLWWLKF